MSEKAKAWACFLTQFGSLVLGLVYAALCARYVQTYHAAVGDAMFMILGIPAMILGVGFTLGLMVPPGSFLRPRNNGLVMAISIVALLVAVGTSTYQGRKYLHQTPTRGQRSAQALFLFYVGFLGRGV